MTSRDDLALLQQTMPTGVEGLKAMEKFCREGNAEVRKLLCDECDIVLECRYCRNLFRSAINFISHKRAFCRTSHVAVVMANQGLTDEDGKAETATKKRVGQMGTLSKRLETNMVPIGDTKEMLALYTLPRVMKELPTTTFCDGFQKVVGSLPSGLAQKESVPEDRVCLTMPQDNSSRYKEMSLRSRRAQNSDKPQNREYSSNEIKIIENFEKQDVRCGDFVLLQCDHPSCAHVRPFHSLQALAYHCSLRHTKAFSTDGGDERWPCLLCCRHMWSLEGVHTHLMRVHPSVKEDHLKKRAEEEKPVKGGKRSALVNNPRRSRSLSMDSEAIDKAKENEDDDEDEEDDEDQEEEMIIEEDEGRGRRRSGRATRRGTSAAAPLRLQQPTLERQSRGQSGNCSDDYGEPPVLHPVGDCALEEEADEEDEEEPVVAKKEQKYRTPNKKYKNKDKRKRSATPESERDDGEEDEKKEVKEEEEEDEDKEDKEGREDESISPETMAKMERIRASLGDDFVPAKRVEQKEQKKSGDSVEDCMEDMLRKVCEDMGETEERGRSEDKEKSESATPPSRGNSASKKRGRPKKSDEERKESPKTAGRPVKRNSGSAEQKTKRQYIRKKDRERMEAEKRGERETASSEHSDSVQPSSSQAAAAAATDAADAARPARHRKRPRWMMNGEEVYDEAAGPARKTQEAPPNEQPILDESEEEDTPKEQIKKKKEKPVQSVTPAKRKSEKMDYSQSEKIELASGPIGDEMREESKELILFTPKAGKAVLDRLRDTTSSSSRKRKQNLGKLADESEDIMIVSINDPMSGPKRSDLTSVPVYLSEHQQQIFFSGLIKRVENDGKMDVFECSYCNVKLPNIRDGRRHMVAHLRVMRLRCGLCGAGAFFCIDMRNHLQLRGCPKLNEAPSSYVRPGTPCMTKEHADELTFVAHSGSPGRALFTSGKIVSIMSNEPYLPDPVIEEKILGPTRVPPRNSSPRKPAHKFTMASALKEAEKGTVSVASLQRSQPAAATPAAGAAAAAAAPPILPIEDAAVHYFEDVMEETEEDAARPRRVASLPPSEQKSATASRAASVTAAVVPSATVASTPAGARRALTFAAASGDDDDEDFDEADSQEYRDISQVGRRRSVDDRLRDDFGINVRH